MALLVQPSSAAAERVFSILSNCFKDQQMHSLEDYIEASVTILDNKNVFGQLFNCICLTLLFIVKLLS